MFHVIGIAQPAIIRTYFADHEGDQIFVICKPGGEHVARSNGSLKGEFEQRRPFLGTVDFRFIKYVDEMTEDERKRFKIKDQPVHQLRRGHRRGIREWVCHLFGLSKKEGN